MLSLAFAVIFLREGRHDIRVSADLSADLSFDPLASCTNVTAQARADAAEATLRERDREGRAAADAAAVRVRELEATLGSLQGSADGPEADLRSQTAEVMPGMSRWIRHCFFLRSSPSQLERMQGRVTVPVLRLACASVGRGVSWSLVPRKCMPERKHALLRLFTYLVTGQASGRAAAAVAELEQLRAREAALEAELAVLLVCSQPSMTSLMFCHPHALWGTSFYDMLHCVCPCHPKPKRVPNQHLRVRGSMHARAGIP